jgi:predicted peptidase
MRFLDLSWAVVSVVLLASCGDGSAQTTSTTGTGGETSSGGGGSGGSDSSSSSAGGSGGSGASTGGATTSSMSAGGGGGLPDGPSSSRLTLRPKGSVPGATIGYAEYLPVGYGDGKDRPLLMFHHGIGESGTGSEEDLQHLYNTGLPTLIKNDQWPGDRPFIVLMTQHDAPPNTSCHSVQEIDAMLQFARDYYAVDKSRVYITGLSCGAIGSWDYLGAHTDEIVAGAVLIAGNGQGAFNAAGCNLGRVPIWGFHGDADPTVPVAGTIDPITSLQGCMNPAAVDAKKTIYPGVGHDSWDMTYDLSSGNDIYAWLLGHSKP